MEPAVSDMCLPVSREGGDKANISIGFVCVAALEKDKQG